MGRSEAIARLSSESLAIWLDKYSLAIHTDSAKIHMAEGFPSINHPEKHV